MSRCRSCNRKLSDRELTRKYINHAEIRNPEDKYIGLCGSCFPHTSIVLAEVNPLLSDNNGESEDIEDTIQDVASVFYQPEEDSSTGEYLPPEE